MIIEKKKFFFIYYDKIKYVNVKDLTWLVFIPYKHQMKLFTEVDESEIDVNDFQFPSNWI